MAAIETRIVKRRLKELKNLETNARYMTPAEYNQLVENLKRDGVLTSTPLVYRDEILSGNHRTKAAIDAGIEEGDVIEILSELTEPQRVAIQLSHNAISGKDDPNILLRLYSVLDLDLKKYSGLTDDSFKLEEIDISALSLGATAYQELVIYFLPEEQKVFLELLERLSKSKKVQERLLVHAADWSKIFDAVVKVKERRNIHNSAVAMRVMAELALERLEAEQTEQRA